MKILFVIILVSTGSILSFAQGIDGDTAFAERNYNAAAEAFQAEIDQSGPNPNLLYNLGNAYYRLGDYGPAILAYEKAHALDPRASDIQTNLRLAREAAAAFDENQPARWAKPLYWLSLNQWLILLAVALAILAILSQVRGFGVNVKAGRIGISRMIGAAAIVAIVVCAVALAVRLDETNRAIVVSPETKIRLSPFEEADVVATAKAGSAFSLGESHGEFFHVGNGWVSRDAVGLVYER